MHIKWLNPLAMIQRAIIAYDPCGDEPGLFVPESDCLEEGSRIVGAFAVKTTFDISTLAEDTDISDAVTAGNMIAISNLAGNWAPGTSNKKPGKGYNREKHSSFTYAIALSHYSVDGNLAFWNTINQQIGWSIIFIFEDLSAWAALEADGVLIPMDITMTPASDDELGGQRRFEGNVGWTTKSLPYALLAPVVAAFTKANLATYFK